jgi:hypothetical protein
MISGRDALARIEHAVAQARRDENGLDAALRQASEQAVRLRAERMEAFRELARLKLDALPAQRAEELDGVERRALALLADRRQALEQLTQRRQAAEAAVQQAEALRHERAAALEQALDAFQDRRTEVEAKTRVDPAWAAQRARLDEVARMAEQAEKKALQAEEDRIEKGRPYEADPLFMYLWRRRFGTGEYRASNLVRYFDRKVARLVGYDKARANYTMLNEIPLRLREHADRVKAEIQAERERLSAVEREALREAGIEPLETAARAAKAALDEAEARLAEAQGELAAFDRAHDATALSGDMPFREAIEMLAQADAQQDLRALYQEAVATPTPRDEAIVKRIEALEIGIGRSEGEMGQIRRRLQEVVQRRAAIEQQRDQFRQRGYDSPYGGFGNEAVLANVLGGILGGVIQGAVLGQVLNQGYHRRPGPWDSDFGGGGAFPSPFPQDSGGGGGGWIGGGGGFETGGGFGGGGGEFRTGGGF